MLFVAKRGKRINEGGERGYLSCHELNIINGLMDKFHHQVHFIDNYIYINNMSLYLLVFFNFFFSHCNSFSIYRGYIYVGVYQ